MAANAQLVDWSADDASVLIRKYAFPAFLVFSVCFYSYRFLFGLGSSLTTYYDADAPTWLRISKDVVWLGALLFTLIFSNSDAWEFSSRNRRLHPGFFRSLFAMVCVFVLMGVLHLFFYQSAMDTFLYWIRYPLEYVPLAFFLSLFVVRWKDLAPLLLGLGWLSIAFLLYEIFSGKQVGFYSRYGSILGSPNDYGIFCALFLIGLLAYATKWHHWLLLVCMFGALLLTLSRSATAGLLLALCSLLYLRRIRIGLLAGVGALLAFAGILMWKFPDFLNFDQVQFGLTHFDILNVDSSGISRLAELEIFKTRFGGLDISALLLGTDYFHIESWYAALLVRTGIPGLLLWLGVMGATIVRGWRYRHQSKIHGIAAAMVICISVASVFIPYPDTFPTNLYLWLAVGTVWLPVGLENSVAFPSQS